MIEKASIYTMNALNKLPELWHTSVNFKARPVVEGEHDKSWNDHVSDYLMITTVRNKLTWYSKFQKINKPRFLREVSTSSYPGQK